MLSQWKREFLEHAADVFDRKKSQEAKLKKELAEKEECYQNIVGQMSYEISWLKKNLASNNSKSERVAMYEPQNERLSASRQAELLGIPRTSLYEKQDRQESYPDVESDFRVRFFQDLPAYVEFMTALDTEETDIMLPD